MKGRQKAEKKRTRSEVASNCLPRFPGGIPLKGKRRGEKTFEEGV